MNKHSKVLLVVLLMVMIIVNIVGVFPNVSLATTKTISNDINKIDDKKYPGIKSMIKELQKKYPKWNFKVLYTGLEWDDVIKGESKTHGNNLVPAYSDYYSGEWICEKCGKKVYDSGNWHCASEIAMEYMIDPRNSLNEKDIFQFLQLSYVDCTYDDVKAMVSNYSYLNKKDLINNVIKIGKDNDMNPFFIMAKIIQEQGNGKSVLATGKSYTGTNGVTYEGYYNFMNIGAYGNGSAAVITNGLKYAKKKGWDTPEKSIEGGILTIANSYIKSGQDTMYFQKFNVSSTRYSYYTHQYMQNLIGAQSEGKILRINLQKNNLLAEKYTFVIPLYEGMPKNACKFPSDITTSSRENDEGRTNNNSKEKDSEKEKDEKQEEKTEEKQEEKNEKKDEEKIDIRLNKEKNEIETLQGITAKKIMENTDVKEIKNLDGKVIKENDKVGTGYTAGEYKIVVVGDVNGDGKINSGDSLILSKEVLKTMELSSELLKKAADVNYDGKINSGDTLILRKYILGTYKISINKGD